MPTKKTSTTKTSAKSSSPKEKAPKKAKTIVPKDVVVSVAAPGNFPQDKTFPPNTPFNKAVENVPLANCLVQLNGSDISPTSNQILQDGDVIRITVKTKHG